MRADRLKQPLACYQRRAGRRSSSIRSRPSKDRHEVWLRDRRHDWPEQPARAHQESRRGISQASADGPHRSLLPTPRRSESADRRCRWHRERAHQAGQGSTERENDPPRSRRAAGGRCPNRILVVGTECRVEWCTRYLRRTGNRICALGTARGRISDRQERHHHQV